MPEVIRLELTGDRVEAAVRVLAISAAVSKARAFGLLAEVLAILEGGPGPAPILPRVTLTGPLPRPDAS